MGLRGWSRVRVCQGAEWRRAGMQAQTRIVSRSHLSSYTKGSCAVYVC